MTRRYVNLTGYPLEVPGLPEPLPPGGEISEDQITFDPGQGGPVTGLTLLGTESPPKPAKKTTTAAAPEDEAGKGATK